jgi:hypothetical protein
MRGRNSKTATKKEKKIKSNLFTSSTNVDITVHSVTHDKRLHSKLEYALGHDLIQSFCLFGMKIHRLHNYDVSFSRFLFFSVTNSDNGEKCP